MFVCTWVPNSVALITLANVYQLSDSTGVVIQEYDVVKYPGKTTSTCISHMPYKICLDLNLNEPISIYISTAALRFLVIRAIYVGRTITVPPFVSRERSADDKTPLTTSDFFVRSPENQQAETTLGLCVSCSETTNIQIMPNLSIKPWRNVQNNFKVN